MEDESRAVEMMKGDIYQCEELDEVKVDINNWDKVNQLVIMNKEWVDMDFIKNRWGY